jgi:cytochrome c551/c552
MKALHNIALVSLTVVSLALGCAKQPDGAPAAAGDGAADGPASIVVPANLLDLVAKADPKVGEGLYVSKGCKACHNLTDVKLVGPGLKGVTGRRSLTWMGKMILKPEVMIKEDDEAKKLFAAMMTPMANQNVAADTELPALLAFLKTL